MACNICSFNLAELCATTVALMRTNTMISAPLYPAPDFVGGGEILYDEAQMREIYENGRGSVKGARPLQCSARLENVIESPQIPAHHHHGGGHHG